MPHLPHFRDSTLGMQRIRRPLPVQPVIQTHHQRTIQSMFFCDASPQAYGAVAYITGGKQSALLMSKARVAPMKQLTIPKLELMAVENV